MLSPICQLDGVACESEERLLIVGATNRPHEIDEAARRRLVKRLYIPLPDTAARVDILAKLLVQVNHCLSGDDVKRVAELTHGKRSTVEDMLALKLLCCKIQIM